jgi:hypothetical protein
MTPPIEALLTAGISQVPAHSDESGTVPIVESEGSTNDGTADSVAASPQGEQQARAEWSGPL